MSRRRFAVAAFLLVVRSAGAAEASDGWTTGPALDPIEAAERVFASRVGTEGLGTVLVDCGDGDVFLDVGGTLDVDTTTAAFLIRFDNDPGVRELAVAAVTTSAARVSDRGFAATLAAREADALHVAPPMLGAARALVFDLTGAKAAFAACGLDLGTLPKEIEGPSVVDREEGDDDVVGIVGGVVGGVIPTSQAPRVFRGSELHVKRAFPVVYPDEAKSMNLGEVTCRARVFIDVGGVPERVEVENCPAVFHAATREALLQWRWDPPEADGVNVPAQTLLNLKFVLPEPGPG